MRFDVVIVGAGQAGAQAAISLRQGGFSGSIALIGDEPDPPYERPPLSKEYLAGEKTAARLLLRPLEFWAQRNVVLRLGERVARVDAKARTVATSNGAIIGYDQLIWAAGGSPRLLPCAGGDLSGVHMIRTRADVDALKADLTRALAIVVIGGGYIGLEAAAVLVKLGKHVTLVEAQNRLLPRVTAEPVSRFYEQEHRAHGVDVRLLANVIGLDGQDGRVTAIRLASGERIACDVAIIGIGITAAIEPLADAGAVCANGVEVDDYCRTSLPRVFAIGDCANHANIFAGGARVRLESVQNAIDQAKVAASAILGTMAPYRAIPWFWSNQYDLKLQTVGLHIGADATVTRGYPSARSFSLVYLKQGRVVALDCINAARDFAQGRALIERGIVVDPQAIADPTLPLKSLLPA